jgi:hypothetical protein
MKAGDIYIGRPKNPDRYFKKNHWGNPFSYKHIPGFSFLIKCKTVEEAVEAYRGWLQGTNYTDLEQGRRQWILDHLHKLKDKRLACFCKKEGHEPCHGDVLAEMADTRIMKQNELFTE